MALLPPCDPAQNEGRRQDIVAAIGEGLFQRDKREVSVIGEKVEAEEDGGKVGREEVVGQIGQGMIVGGGKGVRSWEGVVPRSVVGCER